MTCIRLICDQLIGEPDILTPNKYETLFIEQEEGFKEKVRSAPRSGWTFELLTQALDDYQFEMCTADAFLGDQWIGSTEV